MRFAPQARDDGELTAATAGIRADRSQGGAQSMTWSGRMAPAKVAAWWPRVVRASIEGCF
jgi:hypothetical protein